MVGTIYINQLALKLGRNQMPYLDMLVTFRDTAECDPVKLPAKAWYGSFHNDKPPKENFRYDVECRNDEFHGKPQLIISAFLQELGCGPGKLVSRPAVPQMDTYRRLFCSPWNDAALAILFGKLHDYLVSECRAGKSLLDILLEIPAGASNHHARRAGLLQHIAEMLALARAINSEEFPFKADKETLEASILLHDLGKIHEYSPDTMGWESTDVGERFGHTCWLPTVVGSLMGAEAFKGRIADVLHCVLAHHGVNGGAPVPPKTSQAVLLNLIDEMSAKLDVIRTQQVAVGKGEKATFSKMLNAVPICRKEPNDMAANGAGGAERGDNNNPF